MVLRIAVQPQPCGGGVRSMASDFLSGADFGLCYIMTITFQTIGVLKMGLFQSLIWQGLLCTLYSGALPYFRCVGYPPFAADVLTVFLYLFLIKPMKRMASKMMAAISGRLENLCSNSWIFLLVRLIADENEVWINCGNTNETIYFRITFEYNSDTKGSD